MKQKLQKILSYLVQICQVKSWRFALFQSKLMSSHAHDASWFITSPSLLKAKALKLFVKSAISSLVFYSFYQFSTGVTTN